MCQLESSGKWPEEVNAIDKIKTAFYVHMAKALKGKRGVVASPTKDYLDILKVLEIIMKDALTQKLASSPGHSQFLMIHAKNEKAWFAKSRAPHLGGRVVEGRLSCVGR